MTKNSVLFFETFCKTMLAISYFQFNKVLVVCYQATA